MNPARPGNAAAVLFEGIELRHHTQKQLDTVAAHLNRRPRKRYGYATPDEMIKTLLVRSLLKPAWYFFRFLKRPPIETGHSADTDQKLPQATYFT